MQETGAGFSGSAGERRARRAALIAQLETLWSLQTPADAGLVLRLWYRLVRLMAQPLVDRQRAHNAALLQTLYVMAEQFDALALDTREQLAALEQSVGVALARNGGIAPAVPQQAEARPGEGDTCG